VGANEGQERDIYARHNLNVLWIEPLPDVFRILGENTSRTPRQTAENYLITVRAEAADFEAYIGGQRVSDLDDYLGHFGFRPIRMDKFAESSKAGQFFDVLYRRK
jgi:hypothetical protein